MTSIVLELQHDALQANVSVANLLRKSLVVARKLSLNEFEKWVNAELTGYKDHNQVPEYRKLTGLPVAYSPSHGWYRLMTFNLDPDFAEKVTSFNFDSPISYFESSAKENSDSIIVSYNAAAERMLMKGLHNRSVPALQFDPTQFQGVLDTVRNVVLEWTLRLEADGILGSNMTFTKEEMRQSSSPNLNIENLIGQVINPMQYTEIGVVKMGDIYKTNQAGAVGPNAHAHDMTFNQIWNQLQDTTDLTQLANDLSKLRQEMKKEAVEPEQDIAVSEIAKAQQAALTGNGSKTLEHLRSAGKWALDTATKIGTSLAVETIKKSMGE